VQPENVERFQAPSSHSSVQLERSSKKCLKRSPRACPRKAVLHDCAVDTARICTEVRELQKTTALLTCIQCAAEYCNEREIDLADAVSVVSALVVAASARIDATFSQ
jgi:hypothetical protein